MTELNGDRPGPARQTGARIELTEVSKRYGVTKDRQVRAADDVTLSVPAGAFVALTGASGSGKSTLLHIIGGIDRPDSGAVVVGGTEVSALRGAALARYRRTVGFVFQRYHLLSALTALDNVIMPVLPYRSGRPGLAGGRDARERGRELLASVGLAGRERSLPSELSGGEQQRVAIARALVNSPALLLADEPTGNLDSRNAKEILDLLATLRQSSRMTIVLATHDPQIAARSDRLVRLRDGAVVDDIDLTGDYSPDDTLRRIGQLG